MTAFTLGGPGPGCSAGRLRRLMAGELAGPARAALEEHLGGCARCQAAWAELEEERRTLAAELPFDRFAAGVAERLAASGAAPAPRPRFAAARRWAPAALAASLAVAVAVPLVAGLGPGARQDGTRTKGPASLSVYVEDGAGPRLLGPGEPVRAAARLRVALPATARRHVLVGVLDADGFARVYEGPARPGPLPGAFEWTGPREGAVVAVLADEPVDAAALQGALAARGGAAGLRWPGGDVLTFTLTRGGP